MARTGKYPQASVYNVSAATRQVAAFGFTTKQQQQQQEEGLFQHSSEKQQHPQQQGLVGWSVAGTRAG